MHSTTRYLTQLLLAAATLLASHPAARAELPKCIYVSSYHQGYEWNDGIERGLEQELDGVCTLDRIYLDTKRNTDPAFGQTQAKSAYQRIVQAAPDILIAADDNASKYLIKPYFRDADLPVIFCGINWSVEAYGYPYKNATGMVEIVPIQPLLDVIISTVGKQPRGVYLSSDVVTEHIDFARYKNIFNASGIPLDSMFVSTLKQWQTEYERAQAYDFIILGNNGGINDWDKQAAADTALRQGRIFSVSNYDWMMPYAMFALTKIPEEQGSWAGQIARSLLQGAKPSDIPIISNRQWNMYINNRLLDAAQIRVPRHTASRAIKVAP